MASAFPGALDSFTLNVDNVDDVLAADMNLVQDAALAIETYLQSSHIGENLLYHSMTHNIWPEGIVLNDLADDTYVAAVWNIVSSANTPDISAIDGVSTEPMSKYFRCIMDAASQQVGLLQFLSYEDTAKLRGTTLSLGFDAWGTNITALRAAVLYSTAANDVFASDVVGTWATGNQTLVTNWFYANTPSVDITISSTRARKEVEGIVIPTTANNIAVFIWTPNPEASGDLFNITRVKLEIGDVCTPFSTPGFQAEQNRSQFFVERITSEDDNFTYFGSGMCYSTTHALIPVRYKTPKFKVPTITSSAASTFAAQLSSAGAQAGTAISFARATKFGVGEVDITVASGLVAGNATNLLSNNGSTTYIQADARL